MNGPLTEILAEFKRSQLRVMRHLGNSNREKPLPSLDVKGQGEEEVFLEPSENQGSRRRAKQTGAVAVGREPQPRTDPQPVMEGVVVGDR